MEDAKIDCFAYNNGKCAALCKLYCKSGRKCNFYKSVEKNNYEIRRLKSKIYWSKEWKNTNNDTTNY